MLLRRSQFHLLADFFSVDFAACICVYSVLMNTGKFDNFSLWSHFLWSQNSVPFFEGTSTGYKKYRSITVPRLFFHLDALLTTLPDSSLLLEEICLLGTTKKKEKTIDQSINTIQFKI